jgi:hypothetical protein
MVQKTQGRKTYKTMQGKTVDMDMLRQRNELTPAVGNARVNARGDELGPGGKVIKKREEVMREYYENARGVPDELAVKKSAPGAQVVTPTQAMIEPEDDWVEDEDGNFIPKGE